MSESKKQAFSGKVSLETYNILKEIAKGDNRSLSYLISNILTEYANNAK